MKKEDFIAIEQYMRSNMQDSAHDAEHIYRVLNQALIIAKSCENVNYDILVAACLLHDVGRSAQFTNPNLCHAEVGCEMAYQFLMDLGWSEDACNQIKHCVLTHRFRNNRQPETIEAKILFDADKLDVIGAMGIARTLQYGGRMNYPLDEFLKEYNVKLMKLFDQFYTDKARIIAKDRKTVMEEFYQQLLEQMDLTEADQLRKPTLEGL